MGTFDEIKEDADANVRGLHAVQTGPTDAQLAEQYRQEIRAKLQVVCDVLTRANRDKLDIVWAIGTDAFGQAIIQVLKISKVL